MRTLLALLLFPIYLSAQVPDIDASFGEAGKTRIYSSDYSFGLMKTLQTDHENRIVTAVFIINEFRLHRFLPDGTPDITFGVDTGTLFDLGTFFEGIQSISEISMQITPDNSIFVAVTGQDSPDRKLGYIFKYTENGGLDSTFSDDGIYQIPYDGKVFSTYIKLLPDGSLIVAGELYVTAEERDVYICKLTDNGDLDTGFSDDGKHTFSYNVRDRVHGIEADADGNYFVCVSTANASSSVREISLHKFTSDGTLDVTYGADGIFKYDYSDDGTSMWIVTLKLTQTNDIAIFGGFYNGTLVQYAFLWTISPTGELNTIFGDNGEIYFAGIYLLENGGFIEQNDGKFVAVASTMASTPYFGGRSNYIWRFNPDGTYDESFGDEGVFVATPFVDECFYGTQITETVSSRLILGGTYTNDTAHYAFDLYGLTNDDIVSISDFFVETPTFQVYPNPSTDYITISSMSNEPLKDVQIFNLLGERLYVESSVSATTRNINVQSFPTGSYFVVVNCTDSPSATSWVKL